MFCDQEKSRARIKRISVRTIAGISGILILSVFCLAAKQFVMPAVQPAKTYPAHDQHGDEGVTVALDPYDGADKSSIFSVQYEQIGMLPILLVVTNDGDQPVLLADMKAQLVTADRSKISPAVPDDIERRLSHPTASTNRYPLPFPTKKVKGGVGAAAREEIENAQFGAKAVEPHSTQAGFLFFDVRGISAPLAGAHFYLTGVRNSRGSEMMYFEVPLEKYLSAPRKP
jgi:hypothetical protein